MELSENLAGGIARNLRQFGYPDVTAQTVIDEMAKPESERGIIGMFAKSMLEENGIEVTD